MIAKNIHGLLAKRAGDRIGENREAQEASHSGGENLWGHRPSVVEGSANPRVVDI